MGVLSCAWKTERRFLNSELWHACAGPLVSLPPVGSRVVYFPQGHTEQVSYCAIPEVLFTGQFSLPIFLGVFQQLR